MDSAENHQPLFDFTPDHLDAFLHDMNRQNIHDILWIEVNAEYPQLLKSFRTFVRQQYPHFATREGVLDGVALLLGFMMHEESLHQLESQLTASIEGQAEPNHGDYDDGVAEQPATEQPGDQ